MAANSKLLLFPSYLTQVCSHAETAAGNNFICMAKSIWLCFDYRQRKFTANFDERDADLGIPLHGQHSTQASHEWGEKGKAIYNQCYAIFYIQSLGEANIWSAVPEHEQNFGVTFCSQKTFRTPETQISLCPWIVLSIPALAGSWLIFSLWAQRVELSQELLIFPSVKVFIKVLMSNGNHKVDNKNRGVFRD